MVGQLSTLVAIGRTPHTAPRLTAAAHRALRDGQTWSQLRADPDVIREANILVRRLQRSGWLVTSAQQRCARLTSAALFLVAAGGAVALAVALMRGVPGSAAATVGLILTLGATTLTGWFMQQPPTVTRAGRRHLRHARHLHSHQMQQSSGSPQQWARAVALYGPGALLTSDPAFADALSIEDLRQHSFPTLITPPRAPI
jgi:uncharacterized protein (TIGR04222 family)